MFEEFEGYSQDLHAIINCVGFGTPEKVKSGRAEIFQLTERVDTMILGHLAMKPSTRYVNFSSGVLYDVAAEAMPNKESVFRIDLNSISERDAYRIAKLNSEAKHRAMSASCVFDLRLFSFFTRYVDIGASYLINEMIRAIKEDTEFVTDDRDVVRDYIHPKDLAQFVALCVKAEERNCALDLYSREAVHKSAIIARFKDQFGLRVRRSGDAVLASPTGDKFRYVSENHFAGGLLGYVPYYSSLECLSEEAEALIGVAGTADI
jgi:nucleoside-diphosphate-sugar epimerase